MSKITRRQFSLATIAVSASAAIRRAHAAESPNEKLGMAVIGCGGRGGSHVGGFSGKAKSQVVCLVDPDPAAGARRPGDVEKRQGKKPPT